MKRFLAAAVAAAILPAVVIPVHAESVVSDIGTEEELIALITDEAELEELGLLDYAALLTTAFSAEEKAEIAAELFDQRETFADNTAFAEAVKTAIANVITPAENDTSVIAFQDFEYEGDISETKTGAGTWQKTRDNNDTQIQSDEKSLTGDKSLYLIGNSVPDGCSTSVSLDTAGNYSVVFYVYDPDPSYMGNFMVSIGDGKQEVNKVIGINLQNADTPTWQSAAHLNVAGRHSGWNRVQIDVAPSGTIVSVNGKQAENPDIISYLSELKAMKNLNLTQNPSWGADKRATEPTPANIYIDSLKITEYIPPELADFQSKGEILQVIGDEDRLNELGLSDYSVLLAKAFTSAEKAEIAEELFAKKETFTDDAAFAEAVKIAVANVITPSEDDKSVIAFQDFEYEGDISETKTGAGAWKKTRDNNETQIQSEEKSLTGSKSLYLIGNSVPEGCSTSVLLDKAGSYRVVFYVYDPDPSYFGNFMVAIGDGENEVNKVIGINLQNADTPTWQSAAHLNVTGRHKGWNRVEIDITPSGTSISVNGEQAANPDIIDYLSDLKAMKNLNLTQNANWGADKKSGEPTPANIYIDAVTVIDPAAETEQEPFTLVSLTDTEAVIHITDAAELTENTVVIAVYEQNGALAAVKTADSENVTVELPEDIAEPIFICYIWSDLENIKPISEAYRIKY